MVACSPGWLSRSRCGCWIGARRWLLERTNASCSTAPALLSVREHLGLRCSLQVYQCIMGDSKHRALWLGAIPSPNSAALDGKISLQRCRFCFVFFLLLLLFLLLPIHSRSRATWVQLSFSSDSKGMWSGQPSEVAKLLESIPFRW